MIYGPPTVLQVAKWADDAYDDPTSTDAILKRLSTESKSFVVAKVGFRADLYELGHERWLVFRGTKGKHDLATDLQIVFKKKIRLWKFAKEIIDKVHEESVYQEKSLYFSAHSLGGAIATMAVAAAPPEHKLSAVVFNAPKQNAELIRKHIDKHIDLKKLRVVNFCKLFDPISQSSAMPGRTISVYPGGSGKKALKNPMQVLKHFFSPISTAHSMTTMVTDLKKNRYRNYVASKLITELCGR